MSFFSKVRDKTVEVEATVYPVCTCGEPWASHGHCGGYIPSRPVQNFGTVVFHSPKRLPRILWKLELLVRSLRKKVT